MKKKLPAFTIFLGSFLIFGIQPMLGRTLLPSFGGTAAVWTICLCSYQVLLLAGYFYAHKMARSENAALSQATGATLHIALLGLSVLWVMGFAYLRPWFLAQVGNSAQPALEVLFCVLTFVGLPYILLSANSTLIQAWVSGRSDTSDGSDIYSLYAVSNAGSLLGLLCYPFLLEPLLSLDVQWYGFAGCLGFYAILLACLARKVGRVDKGRAGISEPAALRVERDVSGFKFQVPRELKRSFFAGKKFPFSWSFVKFRGYFFSLFLRSNAACSENVALPKGGQRSIILWWLLPAISTFLLNAVTTHLSTDVTPIPLLWVALLSAFLISYILGFSKLGEKGVLFWCVTTIFPLLGCVYAMKLKGGSGFLLNLVSGLFFVLLGCTFLHSWLYRVRPHKGLLTKFYLCIATGGAIGGMLSGIVAPLLFSYVLEYPLILLMLAGLTFYYTSQETPVAFKGVGRFFQVVAVLALYFSLSAIFTKNADILLRSRNFYGCLAVKRETATSQFGDKILAYSLYHGDTMHGIQFQPHYLRDKATSYYGPYGGGFAVLNHSAYTNGTPMSVGLIGLGAGTMACWGRTNDTYRFFEINPKVVAIASNTNYFTYLRNSSAKVSIALGDARQVLTGETNKYDVLIIDAYSGDAIPYHLATQEAFQLYFDRLKTNGVLAVHISNWHIDLTPLCKAVGEEWKIPYVGIQSDPNGTSSAAYWVFLSYQALTIPKTGPFRETDWTQIRKMELPRDQKGSLISLIRYRYIPPRKLLEILF